MTSAFPSYLSLSICTRKKSYIPIFRYSWVFSQIGCSAYPKGNKVRFFRKTKTSLLRVRHLCKDTFDAILDIAYLCTSFKTSNNICPDSFFRIKIIRINPLDFLCIHSSYTKFIINFPGPRAKAQEPTGLLSRYAGRGICPQWIPANQTLIAYICRSLLYPDLSKLYHCLLICNCANC